jgi:phosphate transport system protein
MPRESLDRRIQHLQDEILLLGSMVEEAVLNAVNVLKRRDVDSAAELYDDDILINEKRFAIENAILILMATQQPIAHDLRLLAAMLEISNELERMGDYAKGIAKVTMKLGQIDAPVPIQDISRMAELAVSMLHRALGAFIKEDIQVARLIPAEDDAVDDLYNKVYHQVVEAMINNPDIIDYANLSMWVAHNLERLADRVTNICERTIFIATGEMMELDSSDEEDDD